MYRHGLSGTLRGQFLAHLTNLIYSCTTHNNKKRLFSSTLKRIDIRAENCRLSTQGVPFSLVAIRRRTELSLTVIKLSCYSAAKLELTRLCLVFCNTRLRWVGDSAHNYKLCCYIRFAEFRTEIP
ncbi:Hypothetical protein PHPALM_3681 [Phytophthora palmivora]|uniref:Uncharacterized protein n=1 Tax=Phytophthora palmivora TaxID=4796 RepID=A0A2P4YLS3_9STRA|nr:Hypothetical protein PHPALM_3681 [Phytophthora palmivora]